jgi:hypothetical protein
VTTTKPERSLDGAALCRLRRNAERAELCRVCCLRNVHAPDRAGTPGRTRLVHPHGSPAHVGTLSRPGTRPGIRPVIRGHPAEEPVMLPRFPAAFRPPAFASWASCPARGFRPSYDRPTTPASARTRTGFPCSTRASQLGWAPSIPRGRRCSHDRPEIHGRRLPLPSGQPLSPRSCHPPQGARINGTSSRVHWCSPVQPSPHLWHRDGTGALGLPLKLRTPASTTRKRTSRAGTSLEH